MTSVLNNMTSISTADRSLPAMLNSAPHAEEVGGAVLLTMRGSLLLLPSVAGPPSLSGAGTTHGAEEALKAGTGRDSSCGSAANASPANFTDRRGAFPRNHSDRAAHEFAGVALSLIFEVAMTQLQLAYEGIRRQLAMIEADRWGDLMDAARILRLNNINTARRVVGMLVRERRVAVRRLHGTWLEEQYDLIDIQNAFAEV